MFFEQIDTTQDISSQDRYITDIAHEKLATAVKYRESTSQYFAVCCQRFLTTWNPSLLSHFKGWVCRPKTSNRDFSPHLERHCGEMRMLLQLVPLLWPRDTGCHWMDQSESIKGWKQYNQKCIVHILKFNQKNYSRFFFFYFLCDSIMNHFLFYNLP